MLEPEYESFLKSRKKPDTVETYIQYLRHISAYCYVAEFIKGKRVLEVGTLNGYGHNIMVRHTDFIVGFDLVFERVVKTRDLLQGACVLRLLVADCQTLPFKDECFDAVVFFHVFEHLEDPTIFLREALRVMTPGGKLFVTTPNRKLRLRPFQKPFPYQTEHVREYTPRQFRRVVESCFKTVRLVGLSSEKKELIQSEKIRMQPRRNIFYAYFPYPFNQIIFTRIYQYLHRKRMNTIERLGNEFFSLEDCVFSERKLNKCIDIVAVCTK